MSPVSSGVLLFVVVVCTWCRLTGDPSLPVCLWVTPCKPQGILEDAQGSLQQCSGDFEVPGIEARPPAFECVQHSKRAHSAFLAVSLGFYITNFYSFCVYVFV